MKVETKRDIFASRSGAYMKATKAGKHEILSHIVGVTGMHRKAVIRRFGRMQRSPASSNSSSPPRVLSSLPRKPGRPVIYGAAVTTALRMVWDMGSQVCAELLHPVVAEYVAVLQRDGMWGYGEETTTKLLAMSEGTMKLRIRAFVKAGKVRRGVSATKPSPLKEIIPIFTGPWQDKEPGYGQLDTVAHCGSSLRGDFAWTVNWTDVTTLWGGRRSQWGKGQRATRTSLQAIRQRLPFAMLGAHPDTGSEFINWHLKSWCDDEGIEYTRSRPYHKNDNAYVEQKNGHVIRRFLGYTRYDCRDTVSVMNELYDVLDLYLNHFVASRKTLSKVRIGSKYKRTYDTPQTPYQRVLSHSAISQATKDQLKAEHTALNPLTLKRRVNTLTKEIVTMQRNDSNRD